LLGIDDDYVDARLHQQFHALFVVLAYADRSARAQLAVFVLTGVRVFGLLGDVFHRHQAAQFERVVDDQHAFQTMAVHKRLGFGERRAFLDGDETIARRHDVAHRFVQTLFEAQVAVGDDADQLRPFDNRETRNAMLARQRNHVAHLHLRRYGDRIAHHTRFETLHLGHFASLLSRRQILVDDAHATHLRHRNGETGFGDGVHGGGHERHIQGNVAGQPGFEAGVARQNIGESRDEEHVIERECCLDQTHGKSYRRKSELYAIPPRFSLHEQQVSEFPVIFQGLLAREFRFAVRVGFEPVSFRKTSAGSNKTPSERHAILRNCSALCRSSRCSVAWRTA
jgi:hypothetical protein